MRLDNSFILGNLPYAVWFALMRIRYAFNYKLFYQKFRQLLTGDFLLHRERYFLCMEWNFLGEKNADFFSRVLWQFRYGKV